MVLECSSTSEKRTKENNTCGFGGFKKFGLVLRSSVLRTFGVHG